MKKAKFGNLGRRKAVCAIAIALLTINVHPALAISLESSLNLDSHSPFSALVYLAQNPVPPQVIDRLRQDLASRTGKPAAQFKVASSTQQTWPDGCLGLAKPEEICSQALVSGWRVVLILGKQQWIYRTNTQASSFRLETASTH